MSYLKIKWFLFTHYVVLNWDLLFNERNMSWLHTL